MSMVRTALCGLALLSAHCLAADRDWQVDRNAALTAAIDRIGAPYREGRTPGMILAVLKKGEVIFLKSYGDANLEFHVPWDPDVVYTFYSTTKSMQAAAVFELQRQGRMQLSDSMYQYLPDFPRLAFDITVAQLLNHTSGLWEDEAAVYYAGTTIGDASLTLDELYALTKRQRVLPYRPGTNVYYCDTGNRLLARIIERVTGKSFGEAMQELVFRPAGMHFANIKNRESTRYPRQATTYLMSADVPAPAFEVASASVETSGDGGGNGSIRDFIAYARFLSEDVGGGVRRIDEMAQPVKLRENYHSAYRYGVIKLRHRGVDVIRHGGLWGKHVIYIPELDVWILSMRNYIDDRPNDWVVEPLVDAVLMSDPDARAFRPDLNPAWNQTVFLPAPAPLTPAELRLFNAAYLEPESGMRFTFTADPQSGRIRYWMFRSESGGGRYLVSSAAGPDGRSGDYESYGNGPNPVNVRVAGDALLLQFSDWGAPRALTRLDTELEREPLRLEGVYFSEVLGVFYTIRSGSDGLELVIGSGNRNADRYALHRESDAVFGAVPGANSSYLSLPLSLRLSAQDGVATGFTLMTPNVHAVEFRRIGD